MKDEQAELLRALARTAESVAAAYRDEELPPRDVRRVVREVSQEGDDR
jgi:hypothetical protein